LSACDDKTAQLWDAQTGKPRGLRLRPSWIVVSAAFSPDSSKVLTGSGFDAQLWDVNTGKPHGPPWRHPGQVEVVAFSPDGAKILVGGRAGERGGEARLWSVATGSSVGEPLRHLNVIKTASFSPDSQHVLTGSGEFVGQGEARLWEAATGKPIGGRMHTEGVEAVAFSPDSSLALTGSSDATARLWESKTGKALGPPLPHPGWVRSLAFSPDGRYFVTASNKMAQVWETGARAPLGPPLNHPADVLAVGFAADSKTLVTGCGDDAARLWLIEPTRSTAETLGSKADPHEPPLVVASLAGGALPQVEGKASAPPSIVDLNIAYPGSVKQVGPPLWHTSSVWTTAFSRDGRTLMTKAGKEVRLWQPTAAADSGWILPCTGEATFVQIARHGQTVLTGGGHEARLWDIKTGKPIGPALQHGRFLESTAHSALSPDGKTVLTASREGVAQLWEAATGKNIGPPLKLKSAVQDVAFTPDGQTGLTFAARELHRWNPASGTQVGDPISFDTYAYPAALSHDGKKLLRVVSGPQADSKSSAQLWDAVTGKPIGEALADLARVNVIAFSLDDKIVALGCADGTARLLNGETGEPILALRHGSEVHAVAFRPGGSLVATAGGLETQLWDMRSGKAIYAPLTEKGTKAVAFSADGQFLATGHWRSEGLTGAVRLWDVTTGKAIGLPLPLPLHVHALAFSPDGATLAVATGMAAGRNRQGESRLIKVAAIAGDVERIVLWTQVITGMELDELGVVRMLDAAIWQKRRHRLEGLGGPPMTVLE
jgi:WD40 repeat protein